MEPLSIGSRRELFLDDLLVERLEGDVRRVFHSPTPQDVVMSFDKPWEGNTCGHVTVFEDDGTYRMTYRGSGYTIRDGALTENHPHFVCYAESSDGIHWEKPDLGLHAYGGSARNNVILAGDGTSNGVVFRDTNPDAAAEAPYKAIGVGADHRDENIGGGRCVYAWTSVDCIHWDRLQDAPVYDKRHRGLAGVPADKVLTWLDSQNTAFWSPIEEQYVMYYRVYTYEGVLQTPGWERPADYHLKRVRQIEKAVSRDFVEWQRVGLIDCGAGFPHIGEQLYTNVIAPYSRAPHILIAMPGRYSDRGWTPSHERLPNLSHRRTDSERELRSGTALTDALLMWSRDGISFRRSPETFLRPGPQRPGTWMYGDSWVGWHVVETQSRCTDAPPELSLYSVEGYRLSHATQLRRYTLRLDGFASLHAPLGGGEIITPPLTFTGGQLQLNVATSAAGSVREELQDAHGAPISGYALDDCDVVIGDEPDRTITWRGRSEIAAPISGQAIRLHFAIRDADLYAMRFG